jgi:hypothetical protein
MIAEILDVGVAVQIRNHRVLLALTYILRVGNAKSSTVSRLVAKLFGPGGASEPRGATRTF